MNNTDTIFPAAIHFSAFFLCDKICPLLQIITLCV